jgi:hypothetical protein
MPHNRRVRTRRTRKLSAITRLQLKIKNQSPLRNTPQRQNITHLNSRFPTETNTLTNKNTLSSQNITSHTILEPNKRQRRSTSRVVRKRFDYAREHSVKRLLR